MCGATTLFARLCGFFIDMECTSKKMPPQKHFTVSERRARALLAAWNSASALRLQQAIAQAALEKDAPRCSGEAERIEMIQEIADTIRLWMNGGRSRADLDASIELLRHLAGSPVRPSPQRRRRTSLQPSKRAHALVAGDRF